MANFDVYEVFGRASSLNIKEMAMPKSREEKIRKKGYDGARNFKRRVLGYLGKRKELSLEEFAGHLVEIGIASSLKEGERLVPKIAAEGGVVYGNLYYGTPYALRFERLDGENKYRITKGVARKEVN